MSQNNQSNQNSFLENALQRNKNAKLEKKGIGEVVKSAISGEMNTIIFIALCMLLIVLVIVLYYYTFKSASNTSLADVDYKKDLKLQKLPTCNEIDEKFRYYLCDYYIASSFNTVSLGNLHFGYVNKDMVKQILLSGARYIQIPICSANINNYAEPVVATAERGKSLITSLNTIDLKEVLAIIKSYAFKYIENSENIDNISKENLQETNDVYRNINYPLIIHLQINTYNVAVLNKAQQYIVEMLGPLLVDASKYHSKPIAIEKLCKLLNKIILFATPGYEQSELRKIVVPNIVLFNRMNQSTLAEKRVTEDNAEDHYSNLSFNKAVNTYKNIDNLGNIIGKILEESSGNSGNSSNFGNSGNSSNSNNVNNDENYDYTTTDTYEDNNSELDVEGKKLYDLQDNKININNSGGVGINNSSDSILNNKKLMDRIVIYNMIGLSLVEPTDSHETYTKNYNPYSAFKNGCQLISMNYQQNDEFMADYIKVFQKSSFVLKPSGLRLPIYETDLFNTLDDFKLNIQNNENIMYDFVNLYNKKYIVLSEMLTDESKVITNKFTNLYFKLNEYRFRQGNDSYKDILDKKSLFKVVNSPLSENNDLVILVSSDDESKAITVNSNFNNEPGLPTNASPVLLGNYNPSDLINIKRQSFYPELGVHNGSDNTISFRLYTEPQNLDDKESDNQPNNQSNNKPIFSQYLAIMNNKLLTLPIQNNKRNLTFNYKKINIRSNVYFKNNLSEQYIQIKRMIVMVSQFSSKATYFTMVKSSENNNSRNSEIVKFKLRINNRDRFLIASGRNVRITKDTNENRSNYTKFLLHYDDGADLYTIESSNGRLLVIDNDELKLIPKDKLTQLKMNEKQYFTLNFDNSII